MLFEKYAGADLSAVLLPQSAYTPFAKAQDRPFWDGLPADLKKHLAAAGKSYAGFQWPALHARLYMENKRNGNRSRYESTYFARRRALGALVLAECAEGGGCLLEDIADGIWHVCEESSWCVPAHMSTELPDVGNPVIDLFAAETASLLAWTAYLLNTGLDGLSPAICQRIRDEVRQRVLNPYLERDDFWWMGFEPHPNGPVNNWNPWCNSNCLAAFLLLEQDEARRASAFRKCLASLDKFLATYHEDGGCDEGTSYWGVAGGALFDCLELLHGATGGAVDVYGEPLIQNIGRFICSAHIAGEYYVNFADGSAKAHIPAELVWRYGARIADAALQAQGAAAFRSGGAECAATVHGSLYRPLWGIRSDEVIRNDHAGYPLLRDAWLPGIQVMAARQTQGSDEGMYLAAKGGHNDESHNHNDVGSFILYSDGQPVLIDLGVETYTAKTFSDERYDIWTMQSQYHNLPTVNGVQQRDGARFRAKDVRYECAEDSVRFELDISGAYPEEAGIQSWKRRFRFHRAGKASVGIEDEFSLKDAAADIMLSFMTPCEHRIDPAGSIIFIPDGSQGVRMRFDGEAFTAASERIVITDEKLEQDWGSQVYRVILKARAPMSQGILKISLEQSLLPPNKSLILKTGG